MDKNIAIIGLPFFGNMIAKKFQQEGIRVQYISLDSVYNKMSAITKLYKADIIYSIGGMVNGEFAYLLSWKPKGKIVMHWVGSDVLYALECFKNGNYNKKLLRKSIHFAEVPWIAEELKSIGVIAEVVPLTSCELFEEPPPFPTKFRILSYFTKDRPDFYGRDVIYKLAQEFPDIDFWVVGSKAEEHPPAPANMCFLGYCQNMKEVYAQITLLIRITKHDGLSFMVLEVLSAGRYVFWTYPLEGVIQIRSYDELKEEVVRLKRLFLEGKLSLNSLGLSLIAEGYNPERVYKNLYDKLVR